MCQDDITQELIDYDDTVHIYTLLHLWASGRYELIRRIKKFRVNLR